MQSPTTTPAVDILNQFVQCGSAFLQNRPAQDFYRVNLGLGVRDQQNGLTRPMDWAFTDAVVAVHNVLQSFS